MKKEKKKRYGLPTTSIKEQKEYFKSFVHLPIIISVITYIVMLIFSILLAVGLKNVGAFFIGFILSSIIGAIECIILKIVFSQKILTVMYLEKISKNLDNLQLNTNNVESNDIVVLSEKLDENIKEN